jgi:hypothetical protein
MATPAQQALFQQWAVNTTFVLDPNATPKAEFTRLAVRYLKWVGGEANWKSHWMQCFGEPYTYNPHRKSFCPIPDVNTYLIERYRCKHL